MIMIDVDAMAFEKFMDSVGASVHRMHKKTGVSRPTITKALNEGVISLECATCIAEYYGKTIPDIFGKKCLKKLKHIDKIIGIKETGYTKNM